MNDRSPTRLRKSDSQGCELNLPGFDDFALSVQANNFWRALKRTEHKQDPAVFFKVSDSFHATAGKICIGYGSSIEHSE